MKPLIDKGKTNITIKLFRLNIALIAKHIALKASIVLKDTKFTTTSSKKN